MNISSKEIIEELKSVIVGKTFDALLPPLIFVLVNRIIGLSLAVILAPGTAVILGLFRFWRQQSWSYALGGLVGTGLASGLVYLTESAASYFISAIVTSVVLLILSVVSLLIKKPLAAWVSHLTRGWPQEWFWRDDVKPAYNEVTKGWIVFFFIRLSLQVTLFKIGESSQLTWLNILLGWPFITVVLVMSYVYGIWRLRNLGGPGVEEFRAGKDSPWEGQKRGF